MTPDKQENSVQVYTQVHFVPLCCSFGLVEVFLFENSEQKNSSDREYHHSLLQLYLDGPKDKLFHIFSYEKKSNKKLTTDKLPENLSFLNNKSIEQIKNSQKNALIKTLLTNKIPFREFKIKKFDEETLGQLFSYFILETAITGKLININPFDQPAVEQVKILTKKQLI